MPPMSRQTTAARSGGDIYFEPIDNPGVSNEYTDHVIKQDTASEEDYIQESIEDTQLKSFIGAYRGTQGGLPAEKGYPIQIGSELFRLSGASIMSDAPSYFSKFFEEQLRNPANVDGTVKTLYIDRDPETFKDIARHLQGYHIHPRDGQHYVKLFADAQFYSLPRLNKQLFGSEIFVQIGEHHFKIPKDIFSSPGDSPNFFSIGFGMFFNPKEEIFPGLDRKDLIRPPPIEAPRVHGRSGTTFADLLQLLRGYPLHIRDAEHRAELLRDCRYYNLKGLEQKVIYHDISFNSERGGHEILMRIEDLRQAGISLQLDSPTSDPSAFSIPSAWIRYARPYADDTSYELIVEIGDSSTVLDLRSLRAKFFNQAKSRVKSLFQVVANKVSTIEGAYGSLEVNPDDVPITWGPETHLLLDGKEEYYETVATAMQNPSSELEAGIPHGPTSKKRKINQDDDPSSNQWMIIKGQWRMCVSIPGDDLPMKIVLHAVKLDAVSGQRGRNQARGFLNV